MTAYDEITIEVIDESRVDEHGEHPALQVSFERRTDWYVDSDYGADADGNRGVRATFIDDDRATEIMVDGKPIAEHPKEIQDLVNDEIAIYLEEHDPDIDEYDGGDW